MKKYFFLGLLWGCSSSNVFFAFVKDCVVPVEPDEMVKAVADNGGESAIWVQQQDALTVRVVAVPALNQLNSYSHGTTIGIYQIISPDKFVKEVTTQTGIKRMLLLNKADDNIMQYDTKAIQPRSSTRFDLSRAEKTRYLGLIVGYNSLITDKSIRLVQIPLVRPARSSLNPVNWFTKNAAPQPAELDILLSLGNNQIDNIIVNVKNECTD